MIKLLKVFSLQVDEFR